MAKFLPGPMVASVSGSQGGTVFSRNRYGQYTRFRAVPVNPNTPEQTQIRHLLSGLSQDWRNLTPAQRNDWDAVAATFVRTDSLGQQINYSGQVLYVSNNLYRLAAGTAAVTTPGTLDDAATWNNLDLTADTAGLGDLSLNATDNQGAGQRAIIYMTAPLSPGRNFFRASDYRRITQIVGATALPESLDAAYEAVYGDGWRTSVGSIISLKLVPLSANFYPGAEVRTQTLIV